MARTEEEVEFRASDLIGPAGTGSNGEKLVNTLHHHYPPELKAALIKRINPALDDQLTDRDRQRIAKIAGVQEIAQARVRGGENRSDQAVVTYAWLDGQGQVWKGCFPYSDLEAGESDGHVSQRDRLAQSPEARDHLAEHPAGGQPEQLEPQVDPVDFLVNASAEDLQQLMREHPERADAVKAFEKQLRGNRARKTVMDFDPAAEAKDENNGGD